MSSAVNQSFLKLLRRVSFIEGVSTLILFFVAMPLKYMANLPLAVTIFGSVHGLLFMAFVGLLFMALDKVPISLTLMIAGVFAAIFPFGPFIFDMWLKKLEQ